MRRILISIVIASLTAVLASCRRSEENPLQVCSTEFPAELLPQNFTLGGVPSGFEIRQVILKGKKWPTGSTLRVRFLNGTQTQQAKFRQYAASWIRPQGGPSSELANLGLTYVTAEPSDIRVRFASDGSSHSAIGTNAKSIGSNNETMHFGWFNSPTTEDDYRRTITHEFGHALGLVHEHQHPVSGIAWNRQQVYSDMGKKGWSKKTVDDNILNAYSSSQTQYIKLDPSSIMIYRIPKSWTTNGFSAPWNTRLSTADRTFIASQ